MRLRLSGFSFLVFFSIPMAAFAARSAVIGVDEAEVRSEPATSAQVLETIHRGALLRVSNEPPLEPVDGFYKVKTELGKIGWVEEGALEMKGGVPAKPHLYLNPEDYREHQRSRKYYGKGKYSRFFKLRILGGTTLYSSDQVIVNFRSLTQGLSYGGEIALNLTPSIDLVLRAEKLFKSYFVAASGHEFEVDVSSHPIMAGVQIKAFAASHFLLEYSALAGVGSRTGLQSQVIGSSLTAVNFTSTEPTWIARVIASWQFSSTLGAFLELGYRWMSGSEFTVPQAVGSGADILHPQFNLNLSGPLVSVGLDVVF